MSIDLVGSSLSAPGEWDRYFQANVGLGPLVGTPGLEPASFGDTVHAQQGTFIQSARRGFFLTAAEPLSGDPLEISTGLTGPRSSGGFPSVLGARRRRVRSTRCGTHSHFEQLVRGARVIGADVRVHHDERGVFAVTGRPVADLESRDPGTAPAIDARSALEACATRFTLDEAPHAARVQQVVFPLQDGACWAYEVAFVVPEHAADVRAFLRADTLELLVSYNVSAAATAHAFRVNPLQTPEPEEAELHGLDAPGNLLRGAVLDVSPSAAARLDRADGDFRVDPADPSFDEANAYHHLWRAIEYFKSIADPDLMSAAPFTPLVARVNDLKAPENAYFLPSTGELRFGMFGSRSSARSAAIVYHELAHAVTDAICELGRSFVATAESRGLSEGYSDYFAASLLDDPRFGDYVADAEHGARNCSDRGLRFPAGFAGPPHATGAVWAAVLWSIRENVHADIADRLAIESVEFLDATSTFEEGRAALHSADAQLNAGTYQDIIDRAFGAHLPA